ncbi:MAG TPA: zinc ribbon domain-containing protein [Chloroflexi bacterium]|nr:zinc ribbon domain-containing protein [Chloroflexota bacterium]
MSSMLGFLIALLLSGLAIAAVAWPLLKRGPAPVLVEDDRLAELLQRKEQVLTSIKDLEFDYRVGKLSEADYQLYDQRLRRQAIGIMQQIEQVAPESAGLDAVLEREIELRRRVKSTAVSAPEFDANVEAEIARRRRVPAEPALANNGSAPRFCTNCGAALAPHHKFCAQCGAPVESGQSAAVKAA